MIDHTGIGVADVGRSAAFYDDALGALGLRRVMQMPEGVGTDGIGYGVNYPVFWIDRFHPHSVKQHTAFQEPRLTRSTVLRLGQAELITARRGCGGVAITPPSFSIRTGITLKRSIAATDQQEPRTTAYDAVDGSSTRHTRQLRPRPQSEDSRAAEFGRYRGIADIEFLLFLIGRD
jgi:catechol 2,3-dioxygenase-like lactoylglutathione lyase family enzyme